MELHMKLSYDQLSGLLQVCNSAVDEHRALALQKDVNLDASQDIFFADVFEQIQKASWRSTALYTSQLQVEIFKLLGNGK